MTTAFNITTDLSQKPTFNAVVGFTRADTLRAIDECAGFAEGSEESSAILATLTRWCSGYLFAAKLDAHEGMYQPAKVVQLLAAVLSERDKPMAQVLEQWVPSYEAAAEPGRELMDYYAPSAAMVSLLPKLVSGRPLAGPRPLVALSVLQQVSAAAPAAAGMTAAAALQAVAAVNFDALTPVDLTETESTIVRTLFYEGLLTHTAGQVVGLHASNEFMRQNFFGKFSQQLAADSTLLKAAERFIR